MKTKQALKSMPIPCWNYITHLHIFAKTKSNEENLINIEREECMNVI